MPSLSTNNDFDQGVEALESEDYTRAIATFQQWLEKYPEDLDALHNLGVAQFYANQLPNALQTWKQAIHNPACPPELLYTILEAGEELQTRYKKANLAAPFFGLLINASHYSLIASIRYAYCLRYSNRTQEALQSLKESLQKHPRNLALILQEVFLLPLNYQTPEEIDWWHKRLGLKLHELEALLETPEKLEAEDIYLYSPIFDIMALGRNDKELLQQISKIWRKIFVPHHLAPSIRPRTHQRTRLGIISGTVYDHSTMHYFQGMFEQLAQTKDIETGVFYFGETSDHYTAQVQSSVDYFVQLPMAIGSGVESISQWEPDVIFYLDIGLESLLYTLAHLRLAPIQCVSAGVPMTTGIDTMDYYISSHWFEPQNAQENYSETLICLDDLMVNMYPPKQNEPLKTRTELGLPEDKNLYIFPHTLIRVDPELDDIFADILKQDPKAIIYLIQDLKNGLHTHIQRRFRQKYPSLVQRIEFLPWMNQADFLNVIACCNVALDSLRLGGGNVTFQSFYVGTPMIQLPTRLLRCRIATGLYKLLDMPEWIAQSQKDYLEKALQLGTQPELRKQVSTKILAGRDKIFKQTQGVENMLNYFRQWSKKSRQDSLEQI